MCVMKRWTGWTIGVLVVALTAGSASGQYLVRQGQVLDANPMVGSGGLNTGRGYLQFDRSNQIITGNAAGGLSFRGYSPIRDPGAFYTTPLAPQGSGLLGGSLLGSANSQQSFAGVGGTTYLPSDSLYTFRRDSYGTMDYRYGRTPYSGFMPYYSSSTARSTGEIVAGRDRVQTSRLTNPYEMPGGALAGQRANLMSETAGGGALTVPSRWVRTTTGQPVTGSIDYRLLANPLFAGAFREVSEQELAARVRAGQGQAGARTPAEGKPGALLGPVGPADIPQPVDGRVKPITSQDLRVSTEGVQAGVAGPAMDSRLNNVFARAAEDGEFGDGTQNVLARQGNTQLLGPKLDGKQTERGTRGTLAGQPADLFAWMRREAEVAQAGGEQAAPGARSLARGEAVAQALAAEGASGAMPIKTFVGTEESVLNTHLKYAEEAMKGGRYYRAEEAYALARMVAPDNPVPALGQCVALLAAGDYVASVSNLFAAMRLFDRLSDFELDLKSLVPDLRVLDSRRADLERRLAVRDDGRLRFLLGFTEYNSGFKSLGVQNMQAAMRNLTDQDTDMTALRRYVEGLGATTEAQPITAPPAR